MINMMVIKVETIKPINGANTMKIKIILILPIFKTLKPFNVIADPNNPPIKVWDEEVGMPKYQVIRFQIIPAIRPTKMTSKLTELPLIELIIVLATVIFLKIKKAIKLNAAAQKTAKLGDKTRVVTIVAIEFAAS